MGRFYLLRHTRPEIAKGLCYGRTDVPLAVARVLAHNSLRATLPKIDQIFCSPSTRCHRLALDLALAPITLAPALRELDFGSWEGLLWSEIPRHESDPWAENFIERAPPGGESFRDLVRRVCAFLRSLSWPSDEDRLLITHSGVIRALRTWEEGKGLARAFEDALPYGSLVELTRLPLQGAVISESHFL